MVDWIKFPDNKPQKDGAALCLSPTVGLILAVYNVEVGCFENPTCRCVWDVEYYIEIPDHPKDFRFPKLSIELVKRHYS